MGKKLGMTGRMTGAMRIMQAEKTTGAKMTRPEKSPKRARTVLAGLALLALAACGGGNEVAPLELQLFEAGKARIQQLGSGKPPPLPRLTRSFLDTVDQPYIEATLERREQQAYMLIAGRAP